MPTRTSNRCPTRMPARVRAVLLASFLVVAFTGTETPLAAGTERRSFDIPSGALSQALVRFAGAAGVMLSADARLTDGKQSPGLQGEFTIEEGLATLLAGSGLAPLRNADGSYTLRPTADALDALMRKARQPLDLAEAEAQPAPRKPSGSATAELPEMTVTASPFGDTSYSVPNATTATTATKTDTPIFDTPVSIQVVPRKLLDDQQVIRLDDALKNVSGVFRGSDFGGQEENFIIRGFDVKQRIFRDGFLIPFFNEFETTDLERVEVLKGPAAFLYGRLEPGGLINLVSKRPLSQAYYSAQQQFGEFDLYRTTFDATGPIPKTDGSLLYRLNFAYFNTNSFRDFIANERKYVAPSLTWNIGAHTQIGLDFYYKGESIVTDYGFPVIGNRPAPLPRERSLSEPDDKSKGETYLERLTILHRFSDAWKVSGQFVKHDKDEFVRATGPFRLNESTGILDRFLFAGPNSDDTLFGTVDLTGRFSTWALQHTLLIGADYYDNEHTDDGFVLMEGLTSQFPAPINIFNPQYRLSPINLALEEKGFSAAEDQWYGIYIQDQIQVAEKWHLLLGGRYDRARTRVSFEPDRSNPTKTDDKEFSQRYGLLYHPVSWLGVYGSYVEGFNAANSGGVSVDGSPLKPELSNQYEAGLKGQWFDRSLSATLAFYQLTKENITTPVIGQPGIFELIGKARSQGIELDVSGQLTDNWSLIGSYTYTDTEITAGNNTGNRLPNVPRHGGSLWTNYEFARFGWPGLKAGLGVFLVDQREGNLANDFQLPGYGRLDAAIGYTWHVGPTGITAQFNVENLLDKEYFAVGPTTGRNQVIPGDPRTFLGSIRVEF